MAQDTTTTATPTADVLTDSVLATARVFVVLLAGFLASKWPKHEPLLTREACRYVSRVVVLLFQPALVIFSTGATLTYEDLKDSWQLAVAAIFMIGLSAAVAWVFARLMLGPEARRAFRPVQLAIVFQNCGSIPLLLLESLCEQDAIKRHHGYITTREALRSVRGKGAPIRTNCAPPRVVEALHVPRVAEAWLVESPTSFGLATHSSMQNIKPV